MNNNNIILDEEWAILHDSEAMIVHRPCYETSDVGGYVKTMRLFKERHKRSYFNLYCWACDKQCPAEILDKVRQLGY